MKTKILLFGKTPPPYIGPAMATLTILDSDIMDKNIVRHFDTSDHRDISTLAKIDPTNIAVAFQQYFRFLYQIIVFQPDIAYILSAQTTIAYLRDIPFILLGKLFRVKIVLHLRGGYFRHWYESVSGTMKRIIRLVHRRVDAQIVLGAVLKPMYEGLIDSEKVFVVPNGDDYAFPETDRDEELQPRVLFLANFIPSKGVGEFVEAARLLREEGYTCDFMAAGGSQEAETQQMMEAAERDGVIEIRETVSGAEKMQLFRESSIFVLPTYYRNEGLPWVIIEAMAAGLPVISTNHAAIAECVGDGENGYLVEKKSAAALVEKLRILLDDNELRKAMGEASRKRYLERFTRQNFIDGLQQVFDAVSGK